MPQPNSLLWFGPDPKPTEFLRYSQLFAWNMCKYLFKLTENEGWVPRMNRISMDVGSAVHAGLADILRTDAFKWARKEHEGATLEMERIDTAIFAWTEETRTEIGELTSEEETQLQDVRALATDVAARAARTLFEEGWTTVWHEGHPLVEVEFFFPISVAPFWVRGTTDWVARNREGHVFLTDHKTQEAFQDEMNEEFNFQMPTYAHAIHEAIGMVIQGSARHQVKRVLPRIPEMNKTLTKGQKTMSRTFINTTWEIYEAELRRNGLNPAQYEDMREKLKDVRFSKMSLAYRGTTEIAAVRREFEAVALEMAMHESHNFRMMVKEEFDESLAYPRNISPRTCRGCRVKDLCFEEMRGGDVEFLQATQYRHRDEKDTQLIVVMEE